MYEKFFSLDELPFEGLPDKRFYYVGASQHQALSLLTQNLSRHGAICVLSGPSGSGKTTLVRMLMRSLPERMRIIAIDDPRLDAHMLLATILRASGVVATSLESIAELTLKLRKHLERAISSGVITTVIIDEAQGLSDEVIEQIRLISNIEGDLGKMINFLLVGQEDLIANIQRPEHKMFWGRVSAFSSIPTLTRDEVNSYVNYRLQQAGCHEPIFTRSSINALYKLTQGLPRLINSIADRSLQIACESGQHQVSARMVKKAEQIVRFHRKGIFVKNIKQNILALLHFLFVKTPVFAAGIATAAAVFFCAYKFLPHVLDSKSIEVAVAYQSAVQKGYNNLIDVIQLGRTEKGREQGLFEIELRKSVIKGDSLDTLLKIWGYARTDGEKSSCKDLHNLRLKCRLVEGELSEVETLGRPAVLSLRDDNLMPFYAVLLRMDNDLAEIVMGDKVWRVRKSWLEHVYDGEFEYIMYSLPKKTANLTESQVEILAKPLQQLMGKDIKGKNDFQESMQQYLALYDDFEQAEEAFNKKAITGPKLKGHIAR